MTGEVAFISFKIFSVTSVCEIKSEVKSHTFNIRSAFFTHESVDLNASMRSVGISLIKPTVSKKTTSILPSFTFRAVGSSVAKSLFSARTSLLAIRFKIEDFPTFVYPARATVRTLFLSRLSFCRSRLSLSSSS